ncbi:MAG TPA: nucleotide excision repair endonuclease [Chitinispirillaceae bacterium]|nr:nucleotide excision repair endonuclease [Chitinispirillaceae bacterium]
MQEEIILYLREHPEGVSSLELASRFLKFKNPEPIIAHKAIAAILKNDRRCRVDNKDIWFAMITKEKGRSLREEPFTAVYCITDPSRKIKTLHYISLLNIFENQSNPLNSWLTNSTRQQHLDTSAFPTGSMENQTDCNFQSEEQTVGKVFQYLNNRIPVFLSSSDCSSARQTLSRYGFYLTDDTILLSELLSALGISVPRPLTLESVSHVLHHPMTAINEISKASEIYSTLVMELIESLVERGVETRAALEELLIKPAINYFKDKDFSITTLQSLPQVFGVYGFKDKNDTFIYIGKANNLRRRLTGYFRETEESPEKIDRLRKDAQQLVTYQCGSELEAIIYEHRLIRKHKPVLNSQVEINERTGTFKPVPDCIIQLPHAQTGKCMLIFMRQNQKVIMKQIDMANIDKIALQNDIDAFFFKGSLPAEPTDFPEMELATRWVKSNRDTINSLEVYNYSGPEELVEILADQIGTILNENDPIYKK